jgi:hypothetical protein
VMADLPSDLLGSTDQDGQPSFHPLRCLGGGPSAAVTECCRTQTSTFPECALHGRYLADAEFARFLSIVPSPQILIGESVSARPPPAEREFKEISRRCLSPTRCDV